MRKLAYSSDPVGEFYRGDLAKQMVKEIQDMGGIMTLADFAKYEYVKKERHFWKTASLALIRCWIFTGKFLFIFSYRPKWETPITAKLNGSTLYTVPPPGSGVILSFIMQILDHILPTPEPGVFWQRLIETFKWAYARRSEFGDLEKDELRKS